MNEQQSEPTTDAPSWLTVAAQQTRRAIKAEEELKRALGELERALDLIEDMTGMRGGSPLDNTRDAG